MSRLPLNTLPAFRAVAQLQNLRAASDVLHLTHSAVSQQIRVLEDRLGFLLFERRGRRVVLNAAGEALLRHVESALNQLDEGVQAAAAAASTIERRLRVSVLPSFAQRWLLPRMSRWRQRHPDLSLEIDVTQQVADLQRDGFHAGLRQGVGPWAGLISERLFDGPTPLFVFGCAVDARRLLDQPPQALLHEPLLGTRDLWHAWFAQAGVAAQVNPVAQFNDIGMMLQACEHGIGLVLAPELLAADAIHQGRLIKLSPVSISHASHQSYHLVYPPALRDWPALGALRQWLNDEIEASRQSLENEE